MGAGGRTAEPRGQASGLGDKVGATLCTGQGADSFSPFPRVPPPPGPFSLQTTKSEGGLGHIAHNTYMRMHTHTRTHTHTCTRFPNRKYLEC